MIETFDDVIKYYERLLQSTREHVKFYEKKIKGLQELKKEKEGT